VTTQATSTSTGDEDGKATRARSRTRTRSRSTATTAPTTAEETSSATPSDDAAKDDDGRSTKGRRSRSRRGRRGRGGRKGSDAPDEARDASDEGTDNRADKDDAPDDTPQDGEPETKEDRRTREAIQSGGTRMAAKRGSRSGGRSTSQAKVTGVPEDVRRAMLDGPPKTMLVTVGNDRTQIAILEERTVVEHHVTRKTDVTLVGNIYMARVQNVLPGMEAAFLDIGKGRNGVLYAGEVLYDDLDIEEGDAPRIEDALKSGQKVLVQVTKDAMGTKGPRLTMQLSLAGRYTVLAPDSDVFGISRKLTDKERDRLRKIVKQVKPDHHGVIVRTAAEDVPEDQIVADLERLLRQWDEIKERADGAKALTAVYEEPPLHVKAVRDLFGPDFERCTIDDLEVYDAIKGYLDEVAPALAEKVEAYGHAKVALLARAKGDAGAAEGADDADADEPERKFAPLFDAYNVAEQLRKAMSRKVWLPSGGYLIIEATEAMKVIDVNTGKYTGDKKTSLEEVVLKTNLEAAEEIVRQLRLRDIGGIIIIDFIDMLLKANRDQVVRKLKRELLRDRTKTRVSDVSRLGLVQMTRKNVSQGLVESFSHKCETCDGHGYISELD
jgi:ribonuclease E